jgi:anthranilate phosphoribosyltransferase
MDCCQFFERGKEMLEQAIEKLLLQEDLSTEESKGATYEILTHANGYQTAAFLMLMRAKGETVDELLGMMEEMRNLMVRISVNCPVLDIVGTGGDGAHTLNISTASAILAASCGVKIAKHGNRSVSSHCGSADVLDRLGINIQATPKQIERSIEEIGIGFMFAPQFHPALHHLKEVRKGLGTRTLFNIIAPLLNPARAQYLMLGVFNEDLLEIAAALLLRLNLSRSLVFHGCGLDELSCLGPSKVIEVNNNQVHRFVLDPVKFGLNYCQLESLKGQDARYNADKIIEAFNGNDTPFADTIAFNAGVAIYLYGKTKSILEGIHLAKNHLKEKKANELLIRWKKYV